VKALLVTAVLALVTATNGAASWSTNVSGGGRGSAATLAGGGAGPAATVSGTITKSVTLTWTARTLSNGTAVGGYVIRRYDSSGAAQTVGPSCSGTVTATTCTETNVPLSVPIVSPYWTYTVQPKQGSWAGAESSGTNVTV
jgi:hypothetical protein